MYIGHCILSYASLPILSGFVYVFAFCPEAIILVKQLLLMVVSCISFKRFDSIFKFAIIFFPVLSLLWISDSILC